MPRRTNVFQEVVGILHGHLAGDASVEESAMLANRVTGEEREVDVVIRSTIAGQAVTVGIEATMQKGSSPWVEGMIGKHADLPTDRLVLVAEKGFSKPARRYAQRKGVALIAPEQVAGDDPAAGVVAELHRVWPKGVSLTAEKCWMLMRRPDGTTVRAVDLAPDTIVVLHDGTYVMSAVELFTKAFNEGFPTVAEQIGLADIVEDRDEFFVFRIGQRDKMLRFRHRGRRVPLYLRWEESETPELHEIVIAQFTGRAVIKVSEVQLTFRRFGDSLVGWGEGPVAGRDALFVVTDTGVGGAMSVRLRDAAPREARESEDVSGTDYAEGAESGREGGASGDVVS